MLNGELQPVLFHSHCLIDFVGILPIPKLILLW